ncbi:MAG TPA: hypothetical protein DEB39_10780 [Planctomycetaceae bacterium]|nr:hypothetical protein [Planctomycetaceae bacterium]
MFETGRKQVIFVILGAHQTSAIFHSFPLLFILWPFINNYRNENTAIKSIVFNGLRQNSRP